MAPVGRSDRYSDFDHLFANEAAGRDYVITAIPRGDEDVLILAPHGGRIEFGTTEIAQGIAGNEYSFYSFMGQKPRGGNRDLHVTSHHFDEPSCLEMVRRARTVVAIHGCADDYGINVGGLNERLMTDLTAALIAAGFLARDRGHRFPGSHRKNICNRGRSGMGAQLEVSPHLRRSPMLRMGIVAAVRSVLASM